MTIETMTEEERTFFERLPEHIGGVRMRKALGIIDAQAEEIERLRAELKAKAGYSTWMRSAKELGAALDATEDRLATATALLVDIKRHAEAGSGRGRSRLRALGRILREIKTRTPAFLANQPAVQAEPECRCDVGAVNCELHQPGAPEPVAPARTKVEQAVLDAAVQWCDGCDADEPEEAALKRLSAATSALVRARRGRK